MMFHLFKTFLAKYLPALKIEIGAAFDHPLIIHSPFDPCGIDVNSWGLTPLL